MIDRLIEMTTDPDMPLVCKSIGQSNTKPRGQHRCE